VEQLFQKRSLTTSASTLWGEGIFNSGTCPCYVIWTVLLTYWWKCQCHMELIPKKLLKTFAFYILKEKLVTVKVVNNLHFGSSQLWNS